MVSSSPCAWASTPDQSSSVRWAGVTAMRTWRWAKRRTLRPGSEGLAQPGTVLMSDETRRLVAGAFDHDDLGQQDLKGGQQSGTGSFARAVCVPLPADLTPSPPL